MLRVRCGSGEATGLLTPIQATVAIRPSPMESRQRRTSSPPPRLDRLPIQRPDETLQRTNGLR